MKKLMMILCTILCANILVAQTQFTSGGLNYEVIDNNSVKVARQSSSAISGSVVIPSTVTYNGTTYSVTSIGEWAFSCCSGLTSVTIPNSVTSIGEGAFGGCSGLTSVTIPNSVTSIGEWAFSGCSGLTSITLPNSLTSIGEWAFSCCSGLTSVTIPNSVIYIGSEAFSDCTGLTSVTIPNSVIYIGSEAFYNCSGLTTLNFNAINCQDFEAYRYNGNYYYPFSGTSLTTVNIGDSVQRIPANFVRDCSGLTSVTIPNSVTSIGGGAFAYCIGLTSVTIPNSVILIGKMAFSYCSGLTTLNFNAINCQDFSSDYYDNPFNGTSLTTVNVGDSVQRIPAYFVRNCSGLTSVTIPNNVTYIGDYAFYGCSSLTSVSIPSNITSIKNGTFYGCRGLTSITLPNSLTSIGESTFRGCSGLTSITLPNSVTSIGDRAFYECLNLSSLISLATVPPTIGNEAFPYPNICTVTVPCGSLAAYTASTCYWSVYFPQRITESSSFELSVSVNEEAYGRVEVENHSCESKTLTAIANDGYEFTGWNDGNTENPRTVTITSDTAFMAIFTEAVSTPTITLTVNDETMGSASYTMDGNTAVLTATANEGYSFLTWSDGNAENPRTVTITSDTAFMAIFAEAVSTPTITLTVNDATMGSATYTMDGNTAVLTATANEGYSFVIWSDGNTENPRTVTITSDTTFMAIFAEAVSTPTITVTVNDATMGSATYTMDGNTAVLTATPNEGYVFTGWNDGNTENPRTVTVTSDTAFMAIFTETETTPTITVTVNDATMGSATYTLDGNTAVLTATPNEGYEFTGWNDGNTENPRTVTVTSDTAFMAIFTLASSLQEVNAREFALYPNPAKSFVTLEFETLEENTLLQILDINGRRVRTLDLKAGVETLRIDLGDLPKGVYTIMLGNTTKKLIVE